MNSGVTILTPFEPALVEAVRETVAGWEGDRVDAGSAVEVESVVGELADAIRRRVALSDGPIGRPTPSHLSRRLLARLRAEFIAAVGRLTPLPDTLALVSVLQTVETVGADLEPKWDQEFSDRLEGPDGLDLVVEVAHDLRSPLTSILFLAETLQRARSGPVTPIQERQLGLIYSAAFGLSTVASDVIELARGGDRLMDVDAAPFSLPEIMESVRDMVQPIAEEKRLEIRVVAPVRHARVGYQVAVSRVLLNLTTNALKFTEQGFVQLSAVELDNNRVEIAVSDSGHGIPEVAITALFQPFRRRGRAAGYAFSGSGLGLSICRKLVEAMHSELKVETGRSGTRFSFTLELPWADEGSLIGMG